jgi:hypothetical protein
MAVWRLPGLVCVIATQGDDLAIMLTHVLRQAAMRRLTDLGIRLERVEVLICSGSKLGNRWLV